MLVIYGNRMLVIAYIDSLENLFSNTYDLEGELKKSLITWSKQDLLFAKFTKSHKLVLLTKK